MEHGSSSRRSWADQVEDEDLRVHVARSRGLNPDAEPFFGGSSPGGSGWSAGGKLSFSDSEVSFGSEMPSPDPGSKGKAPAEALGRRCRHRRRRRRPRGGRGLMANAQRSQPPIDASLAGLHLPRKPSLAAHPARLSAEPDTYGYREVHSRRRWRRGLALGSGKPVPEDLVGLCFNCFAEGHTNAVCMFPLRCRTCRSEGHRARNCPWQNNPLRAKRGRSPAHVGSRRGAPRRRSSVTRWRPARDDTPSACSVSTGRSPLVPPCCAPLARKLPPGTLFQRPLPREVRARRSTLTPT